MTSILFALLLTIPGDVNQSGSVNITDVVDLINYIFGGVEIPRKEWAEVDTTVSVVWIGDRAYLTDSWPIEIVKHYYVLDECSDTIAPCTTMTREVRIKEATYLSGNEIFRWSMARSE